MGKTTSEAFKKNGTSCPNWGGGLEVIWAMPERKHFFAGGAPLANSMKLPRFPMS